MSPAHTVVDPLAGGPDFDSWPGTPRCIDADPDMFFPDKGGSTHEAKQLCAVCPVREPCLTYAVENDQDWGIWGGLSNNERRAYARRIGHYRRVARRLHIVRNTGDRA